MLFCRIEVSRAIPSSHQIDFQVSGATRNNIIDMNDVKAISKNFGRLDLSMDGTWALSCLSNA